MLATIHDNDGQSNDVRRERQLYLGVNGRLLA